MVTYPDETLHDAADKCCDTTLGDCRSSIATMNAALWDIWAGLESWLRDCAATMKSMYASQAGLEGFGAVR